MCAHCADASSVHTNSLENSVANIRPPRDLETFTAARGDCKMPSRLPGFRTAFASAAENLPVSQQRLLLPLRTRPLISCASIHVPFLAT